MIFKATSHDYGYRPMSVKNTIAGLLAIAEKGEPLKVEAVLDAFGEEVSVEKVRMYISSLAKLSDDNFVTRVRDGSLYVIRC